MMQFPVHPETGRCLVYVYQLQGGPSHGKFLITTGVVQGLVTADFDFMSFVQHMFGKTPAPDGGLTPMPLPFTRYRCIRDPTAVEVEPHFVADGLAARGNGQRSIIVDLALAYEMCGLAVHAA